MVVVLICGISHSKKQPLVHLTCLTFYTKGLISCAKTRPSPQAGQRISPGWRGGWGHCGCQGCARCWLPGLPPSRQAGASIRNKAQATVMGQKQLRAPHLTSCCPLGLPQLPAVASCLLPPPELATRPRAAAGPLAWAGPAWA